jgi:uncharacterized DUF497 family protein
VAAEFDANKDVANIRKHGVSMSEGDGVLNDPFSLTVEDDASEGEHRYITIGMNSFGVLMVVVHTPRLHGTRLISVRKAEPRERRNYEKGI